MFVQTTMVGHECVLVLYDHPSQKKKPATYKPAMKGTDMSLPQLLSRSCNVQVIKLACIRVHPACMEAGGGSLFISGSMRGPCMHLRMHALKRKISSWLRSSDMHARRCRK